MNSANKDNEFFSAARLLSESQDHIVCRGEGLRRNEREDATSEGRAADTGERGETAGRDNVTDEHGRQAGPLHAPAAHVSFGQEDAHHLLVIVRCESAIRVKGDPPTLLTHTRTDTVRSPSFSPSSISFKPKDVIYQTTNFNTKFTTLPLHV